MIRVLELILALVTSFLLVAGSAVADVGIGVNLGSIDVEDRLARGGSYNLPTVGVINTGDQPGDYEVAIGYLQDQRQQRPPAAWFEFRPRRFYLEAGKTQNVEIRLTLPTGAAPGGYFAFIEAHPVAQGSGVTIGAAAATRLSFTVEPSSWLEAQRLRLARFLDDNQPWTALLPAGLLVLMLALALRRFFRLSFRLERR